MRIRKRPAAAAAAGRLRVDEQKSWLKFQEDEHEQQQQQAGVEIRQDSSAAYNNTRKRSGRSGAVDEQQGGGLMALAWATTITMRQEHVQRQQKCKAPECPISGGIPEEGIGEEPRTPPPFSHEKKKQQACSCSNKRSSSSSRRRNFQSEDDGIDRDSSSSSKKRRLEQQQPPQRPANMSLVPCHPPPPLAETPSGGHGDDLQVDKDTAESSGRCSHENCGPEQRVEADGEAADGGSNGGSNRRTSRGLLKEEDVKDMGPLLRAVHAVISEAGIQGLTAREASELILARNMLSEDDIPRSVKMAKAMRDSPYLLELGKTGKFVMWSTFLEESGAKRGHGNGHSNGNGFVKNHRPHVMSAPNPSPLRQQQQQLQQQQQQQQHRPQLFNVKRKRQNHNQQQQQHRASSTSGSTTRTAKVVQHIKEPHDLLARVLEHVEQTLREAKDVPAIPLLVSSSSSGGGGGGSTSSEKIQRYVIDINNNPPPDEHEIPLVVKKPPHWPILDLNLVPDEHDW